MRTCCSVLYDGGSVAVCVDSCEDCDDGSIAGCDGSVAVCVCGQL